jgi:3-oxoacyl-[acyl-carrier protein] reductase
MNSAASGKTEKEAEEEIRVTALRRQGEPEDVADAVALLCTDDARWVTGAWLDVSGGIRL